MRRMVGWIIAVVWLTACAAGPARAADETGTLAGTWRGTMTGIEMQTAGGQAATPATLTVAADGTWTLGAGFRAASSAPARVAGTRVVLEGRVVGGEPFLLGRPVTLTLERRGGALYGSAQAYFGIVPVFTGITLTKTG